jgi:hypothetical protein
MRGGTLVPGRRAPRTHCATGGRDLGCGHGLAYRPGGATLVTDLHELRARGAAVVRPRGDLLVRDMGDEVVVLDRRQGRVHHLNATAGFVWQRLDGRTPAHRIATAVANQFEVDLEAAVGDVMTLVRQLDELGLVVAVDPRPDAGTGTNAPQTSGDANAQN